MIETLKQRYIRWYYGSFVNDPRGDVIMFGVVRPLSAMRLTRRLHWLRRNRLWLVLLVVALMIGIIF